MPGQGSLLSRGRGAVLLASAALVVWFAAGWARGLLLDAAAGSVLAIPWIWARRLALGALVDLPVALLVVPTLAAAGRVVALRPWPAPVGLVVAVAALDAAGSHLVNGSTSLWTDPLVVVPRLMVAAAGAVVAAALLARLDAAPRGPLADGGAGSDVVAAGGDEPGPAAAGDAGGEAAPAAVAEVDAVGAGLGDEDPGRPGV
jgi:hypothetical protein